MGGYRDSWIGCKLLISDRANIIYRIVYVVPDEVDDDEDDDEDEEEDDEAEEVELVGSAETGWDTDNPSISSCQR